MRGIEGKADADEGARANAVFESMLEGNLVVLAHERCGQTDDVRLRIAREADPERHERVAIEDRTPQARHQRHLPEAPLALALVVIVSVEDVGTESGRDRQPRQEVGVDSEAENAERRGAADLPFDSDLPRPGRARRRAGGHWLAVLRVASREGGRGEDHAQR